MKINKLQNNYKLPFRNPVKQVGIQGENVEIKANNVYIINNTYNDPNIYYPNVNYWTNNFSYSPFPLFLPFFHCYTIPFVPWIPMIFPYIWGW